MALGGSGTAGSAAGSGLGSTGRAASGASRSVSDFTESVATAAATMQSASDAGETAGSSWRKASDSAAEAGSSFGDLAATSIGVSAGLESTADDADVAEGGVDDLSQAADRAKEALGAMGIAAGATGLIAFFQDAVMAASDLEESTNVVNTLFEGSSGSIMNFAATAKDNLGMSNLAAREAAGTFGIYGKQAELAAAENAKFSMTMTTLAADMASFRNTSPEQAIDAIGAAFRGESDPIEAYGVIINETILKNRALAAGLISTTADALTPAVRVQMAYNEILAQTTFMQGDLDKTQMSLSNRIKALKADFIDQSAAIGSNLMPVAQAFVSLLSGPGMFALEAFGGVLQGVGTGVQFLGRVFGDLPGPIQAVLGAMVMMRLAAMLTGTQLAQNLGARATQVFSNLGTSATIGAFNVARALTTMRLAYAAAGGGIGGFTNTLRAAGTVGVGAFTAGLRGLMGFLGGPWGLAMAAATIGVGLFMKSNGEAKAHLDEVRGSVSAVAQELDKAGGNYTDAGVKAAAGALEQIKMADGVTTLGKRLRDLGVSSNLASQGLAGNVNAMKATREELEKLAAEEKARNTRDIDNSLNPVTGFKNLFNIGGFRDEANKSQDALKDVDTFSEELVRQQESLKAVAAAGGDVVFNDQGVAAQGVMKDAMDEFSGSLDGAAARVKTLSSALAQLQGDSLTVDDAMQQWNDTIRELGADTSGFVGLIDPATGAINTLTEANSRAFTTAKSTALSLKEVAASTYEQTGSMNAVREAIAPLYDEFERLMVGAGLPQGEIDALAAKLGMLPTDIVLSLMADDYPHATELARILGDTIIDVPDGKTIHVQSNSPEVANQVRALGFDVENLEDGSFRIVADTAQAMSDTQALNTAINNATRMRVVQVQLNEVYGAGSSRANDGRARSEFNADGNIIRAYAAGGINALSAMPGRDARVVPPNTWRVVGDRARDDEFFIPDTDEPQHVSLGMEWARRRGLIVVDPKALTPMADGGLGFGGYSGPDTRDYMRPTNLSEVFALASGLGFTAVSGVSNYASMAASGQWDLSKLTPQFDRSNNTIPGVDKALSAVTERLDTLIETLQQGGLVEAKFDVSNDMSARLTKAGIA